MTGRRRKLLTAAVFLLLAGLALWRLTPRSLYTAAEMEKADVTQVFVIVSQAGVGEGGVPFIHTWKLDASEPEDIRPLLEILEGKGYRPDLRNLLPWPRYSAEPRKKWSPYSAVVTLAGPEQETASLIYQEGDQIDTGKDSIRLFHPVDRTTLERLAQYVMAQGHANE